MTGYCRTASTMVMMMMVVVVVMMQRPLTRVTRKSIEGVRGCTRWGCCRVMLWKIVEDIMRCVRGVIHIRAA